MFNMFKSSHVYMLSVARVFITRLHPRLIICQCSQGICFSTFDYTWTNYTLPGAKERTLKKEDLFSYRWHIIVEYFTTIETSLKCNADDNFSSWCLAILEYLKRMLYRYWWKVLGPEQMNIWINLPPCQKYYFTYGNVWSKSYSPFHLFIFSPTPSCFISFNLSNE